MLDNTKENESFATIQLAPDTVDQGYTECPNLVRELADVEVDKVADMVVDQVADMVTNMKLDMVVDDVHTNGYFYRTQVSLGSGLWVPVSVPPYESFVKLY